MVRWHMSFQGYLTNSEIDSLVRAAVDSRLLEFDRDIRMQGIGRGLVKSIKRVSSDLEQFQIDVATLNIITPQGTKREVPLLLFVQNAERQLRIIHQTPQADIFEHYTRVVSEIAAKISAAEPVNAETPQSLREERHNLPLAVHSFSTLLPILAVSIVFNATAGPVVHGYTKGLLFLDTVGTCIVALVFGPWYALVCGCLSNVLASVFSTHYGYFSIVNASLGFYWGCVTCLRPRWSRAIPAIHFIERLPFIFSFGFIGALLATVIGSIVYIWELKASFTNGVENSFLLYQVAASYLNREPPDILSFGVSYMLYTLPDKIASVLIALLIISYLLPLYSKEQQVFELRPSLIYERIGPVVAAVLSGLFMILMLMESNIFIAVLWLLLFIPALICSLQFSITMERARALDDWIAICTRIETSLKAPRNAFWIGAFRILTVCTAVVGYYLIWYFIVTTYHFGGAESLHESLLHTMLVIGLVCATALLITRIVVDNVGYILMKKD
jgi:hypothetical protein